MAEHFAGLRIDETMVGGIGATRNRARMLHIGGIGLATAALVVLLIAGIAMHDRHAPHASMPVAPRAVTRAEARLIANNTANLPNAVAPEIQPSAVTREQQRLLEVNTMLPTGGLYPYAEDVMPLPGQPR